MLSLSSPVTVVVVAALLLAGLAAADTNNTDPGLGGTYGTTTELTRMANGTSLGPTIPAFLSWLSFSFFSGLLSPSLFLRSFSS